MNKATSGEKTEKSNECNSECNGSNQKCNKCNFDCNGCNENITPVTPKNITSVTPTPRSARENELHDAVVSALDKLEELNLKPTVNAIRELIGSGSNSTLLPIIHAVKAEKAKLKLEKIKNQKYRNEFIDAALYRASELLYSQQNQEAEQKVREMQIVIDGFAAHMNDMVKEITEENRIQGEEIARLHEMLSQKNAEIIKIQKKYDTCQRELEGCRHRLTENNEGNTALLQKVLDSINELKVVGKKETRRKSNT